MVNMVPNAMMSPWAEAVRIPIPVELSRIADPASTLTMFLTLSTERHNHTGIFVGNSDETPRLAEITIMMTIQDGLITPRHG